MIMNEHLANEILSDLRNGNLSEYIVIKEEFPLFRDVLVKQEDKKAFRGIIVPGGGETLNIFTSQAGQHKKIGFFLKEPIFYFTMMTGQSANWATL